MNDQVGVIIMLVVGVLIVVGLLVLWRSSRGGRQGQLRQEAQRHPATDSPATSPRGVFPDERQEPVDPRERRDGPGPGA